ncbi:hypothetical protein LguiA_017394 [Lonicera macranthoides]
MEILPCSGVRYVGDSDCPQQGSTTAFVYNGEVNRLEQSEQVEVVDVKVDDLVLNVEGSQEERQGGGRCAVDEFPTLEEAHSNGDSFDEFDSEDESLNAEDHCVGNSSSLMNSQVAVDDVGSGLPSSMGQQYEPMAVWVKALIETARNVMVWKEFAMEAYRSKCYSDLGRMLLKLQNMILQCCLNSDWLQHSLQSWAQRCQSSRSAESVEMLKEELADSIIWNEVNSISNVELHPELESEWKTWKQEVLKSFSMSNPVSSAGEREQQSNDSPSAPSLQSSRKRAKLEVRRAEPHASPVEPQGPRQSVEIDSRFFDGRNALSSATLELDQPIGQIDQTRAAPVATTPGDRWGDIVVETGNSVLTQTKDLQVTPSSGVVAQKSLELGSKNRQCMAFIEAKGRQCVRWANDGDVYCCVHLASRFVANSAKAETTPPVDSPMCEGTTVLGTKCKHRSLFGSSFCKKHRPHNERTSTLSSPENKRKRHHEESINRPESSYCKDIVLVGEAGPLQVDPVSVINGNSNEMLQCIGSCSNDGSGPCLESPKRHSLYCEKHLPSWLKRARNGKSRIVSKEVFMDLLRDCYSREQKLHLHQACELFYRLFKSILSLRNPVPKEIQLQWAISEASKDVRVGEVLTKLVCSEKQRLERLWGFNADKTAPNSPVLNPIANDYTGNENVIKCKICLQNFLDDQTLGAHWMENHKKEAQWHFRGYVCAICLDSFTNKKVLEAHVQERHCVQFVEQCMLYQCIPCGSHFGNPDELWLHVRSLHVSNFRLPSMAQLHNIEMHSNLSAVEYPSQKLEPGNADGFHKIETANSASADNTNSENHGSFRKFICRFCGIKFDLLPDLGRHHQAAHMGPHSLNPRLPKRGIRFYAHRLKSGRLTRPRFKKGLGAASYKIRNRASTGMKKHISHSFSTSELGVQSHVSETDSLGRLAESHCSAVAKILFSEIKRTEPRPSNFEILSIARSACCKVNLQALLEEKYKLLPERLYLKAAKLCSENNILVDWHQDGFVCPKGCMPISDSHLASQLVPLLDGVVAPRSKILREPGTNEWAMDECHYIIDSRHFRKEPVQRSIILCDDISFGKESVPITCAVDENLLGSLNVLVDGSDGQNTPSSMPWETYTYIMKPLLDRIHHVDAESLQLGCACAHSTCSSGTCDHVYLFDNDYEDAKDVYGKPMSGRFPYDKNGRIILEEGYLVYECNQRCRCSRACQNRVLQNGVRAKLEGWAVRAGEAILRGTFVCEYVGEVIDEEEANKRRTRYGKEGCSYFYDIDSQSNDMSRLIEGQTPYVIDARNYGNVSRFINHSCSPNLTNHQVLVESMDCQLAHIGFYASQDIALGEELTFNYRYKLMPGEGCQCHCGDSNCKGRLY